MSASKRVKVDDRIFIVDFDTKGEPARIKERKMYGKYPIDGWCNAPYWSAKHHKIGSSDTIVARVLAAAQKDSP